MGGRSSNGNRNIVTEASLQSYGGARSFFNQFPYSSSKNPLDERIGSLLESTSKEFDSNIEPYYSREDNTIYIGISNGSRANTRYDLSVKKGNEFKGVMKEKIESFGFTVEKMGKRKFEGEPEFWFRVKRS